MLLLNILQSKLNIQNLRMNAISYIHYLQKSFAGIFSRRLYANRQKKHFFTPRLLASFSVEAAVIMPVFICLTVAIMVFFRVLCIQWGISVSAIDVARQGAVMGDVSKFAGSDVSGIDDILPDKSGSDTDYFSKGNMLGIAGVILGVQGNIKANDVKTEFISMGNLGINFLNTRVDDRDIDIITSYRINAPIKLFGDLGLDMCQRTRVRRWTGYDPGEESNDEEYVYIAKTGRVYHKDINCTYLNPSVSAVNKGKIKDKRNLGMGKYHPCQKCGDCDCGVYYITDYGDVYHSMVTCPALKRSISRKTLREAKEAGYGACSKCGR